jgi:hypothetical protein
MITGNNITNIIPEDIINLIISFIYDRRGYNTIEYAINKKNNRLRNQRICIELKCWKKLGVSISWLRPTKKQSNRNYLFYFSLKKGKPKIVYHIGAYTCMISEINEIKRYERNVGGIILRI